MAAAATRRKRPVRLDDLRRHAVARTLFRPTTLTAAIARLGFVQADPIRAPARAQDLILRHRVTGYPAGDLERRYPRLPVEEDYLVNYGFLLRADAGLLHPRAERRPWTADDRQHADQLMDLVRRRRVVLPRKLATELRERRVTNAWGGQSNAVTALLDAMHYRGMLRVHSRVGGHRRFAPARHHQIDIDDQARADALLDVVVRLYAPLPSRSLTQLASMLHWGAPDLFAPGRRAAVLDRARQRLGQAEVDGVVWYWPADEDPRSRRWRLDDELRLLAPFDPIVWDRLGFEILWGWSYRFEAYTPAAKRQFGYYALPILWRDDVAGWATVERADNGATNVAAGWARPVADEDGLARALDEETARITAFLTPDNANVASGS